MKKYIINLLVISLSFALLNGCQSDAADNVKGSIKVSINHLANGAELDFTSNFTNAAGESLKFTQLKYYLSNFSLVKTDGSVYTVPKDECYFLLEENAAGDNPSFILNNIPEGEYNEIRFILGVDSLKSTSPNSERTGVLDPATNGMYWAWNSGYRFIRIEGKSPSALLDTNGTGDNFVYHIGLFGGMTGPTVNNIKSYALKKTGHIANVSSTSSPHINIDMDIMEAFKTPTTISLETFSTVHVSPASKTIADNYADMFSLNSITN